MHARAGIAGRGPILFVTGVAGGLLIAGPLISRHSPMLLWNASKSMPEGLYLVDRTAAVRTGDIVAARLPPWARILAAQRNYVPPDVPIIKRVAAGVGAMVCANGATISIGGRRAGVRLEGDARGRALPHWTGCMRFGSSDYLLLGQSLASFDGRYFGPSTRNDLAGRAELLWPH